MPHTESPVSVGDIQTVALVGISFSAADGLVFLRGHPSAERPLVILEQLRRALHEAGFAQCLVDEAALLTALDACNTQTTPFVFNVGALPRAQIVVTVAPDAMSATLDLLPAEGAMPTSIDEVIEALATAGVVYGLDFDVLREACAAGQVAQCTVASGTPPVAGTDAQFDPLLDEISNRAPKVDANGLIDYREHSGICLVEPGAPLMRRTPATPGVAGRTITSVPLEPVPGKDLPFAEHLTGALPSELDPNVLCAAIKGQPVLVPQGVQVEPVLRVVEVNLASGNIYFDGSVQVDGDVMHSMKVEASGDVSVGGTVEGGLIVCGGNLLVGGGIIAQAQVQCQGSVTARFAQSAQVRAGTTLLLHDMALDADLQAGAQILIGEKSPQRGKLVGGMTTAMMLVRVPTLGSDKSGPTSVFVGSNPELEERYQRLQERIDVEKTNEDNLQKLVNHLSQVGDPKGMLEKVKASWRLATQTWAKSLGERAELEQQLAVSRKAKVEVTLCTLGPVELSFGKRKVSLRKEFGPGAFSLDPDGRAQFTEPSGRAYPMG
jgi:uncharacterized protein